MNEWSGNGVKHDSFENHANIFTITRVGMESSFALSIFLSKKIDVFKSFE